MHKPKILVILGSIREGRNGQIVADWAMNHINQRQDADFEVVDLKDYPMPLFDQAVTPSMMDGKPYDVDSVKAWTNKIGEADGFIFITAEYNHSVPGALKNAIDYVYQQWNNKAVGFISYGSIAGGSRSVEHLRGIAAELQMADVRTAVHIPNVWAAFDDQGNLKDESVGEPISIMLDQVVKWSTALKTIRS